jgi:thioredoxin 1
MKLKQYRIELKGLIKMSINKKPLTIMLVALFSGCFFLAGGYAHGADEPRAFDQLPVKGTVTLIDLGAKKCIPCKMMAPILEKMEKTYADKAAVAFIDVWQNQDQAQRFKISAIPTQIFFDASGKEVFRHVGFMSEAEITQQFEKMGVK